jgi:hypothetical protein
LSLQFPACLIFTASIPSFFRYTTVLNLLNITSVVICCHGLDPLTVILH